MGIEEVPDLQRMLRRCYTGFLALRKPGGRMTKLMNLAILVGTDIGNLQPSCSQGVVTRYVGALMQLEGLLKKVTCAGAGWLFRWRMPPVKCMEKLQGLLEDIHGDVHALVNVVRSQHHQSRTTISVLVTRLGKGNKERREGAARKLAIIAGDQMASQEIANMGGVKMLIDMLGNSSTMCQFHALHALSNMALADQENQESILYHGGLDKIGNLLISNSADLREQAVTCLGNMTATLPVHLTDSWSRILHNIKVLLEPSSPCKLQAVRTVAGFSQHIPFRECLIMHGTSKPLLQLATEQCEIGYRCAILALAHLSGSKAGCFAMVEEGGVQVLLKVIKNNELPQTCRQNVICCLANMAGEVHSLEIDAPYWKKGLSLLLKDWSTETSKFEENVLLAVANLSRDLSIHDDMIAIGAIPRLVEALSHSDIACVQRASIALTNMACNPKHSAYVHTQIIALEGTPHLVAALCLGDQLCREHNCRTLSYLSQSRAFHTELLATGIVGTLLDLLQVQPLTESLMGHITCILSALSTSSNGRKEIYRCSGRDVIKNLACTNPCMDRFVMLLAQLDEMEGSGDPTQGFEIEERLEKLLNK